MLLIIAAITILGVLRGNILGLLFVYLLYGIIFLVFQIDPERIELTFSVPFIISLSWVTYQKRKEKYQPSLVSYDSKYSLVANDNSQKPIFTNTIAQSSKYNSVNLMIDNIEVKVEDSRVIFTQAQDIGISSCVVYVGLVGEIKKRIGSINASVETHLDNGEYAFDIEIDGLVHRSGVFRIGKVPESVEVLNKSEKEIGQLQPKDKFLDSTILQLRQASEMLKEGIITKQEFDKIKDRLIQ